MECVGKCKLGPLGRGRWRGVGRRTEMKAAGTLIRRRGNESRGTAGGRMWLGAWPGAQPARSTPCRFDSDSLENYAQPYSTVTQPYVYGRLRSLASPAGRRCGRVRTDDLMNPGGDWPAHTANEHRCQSRSQDLMAACVQAGDNVVSLCALPPSQPRRQHSQHVLSRARKLKNCTSTGAADKPR